jgi:hypothetical protein
MNLKGLGFRIILFPFFAIFILATCFLYWLKWCFNWLVYGAEVMSYSKTRTTKSISDVYDKISEVYK